MKDLKLWLAGAALLACSGKAMAQNEVDALRYSNLTFGGTARIQGIAGAQTALGADASSMSGNPAGLGFYRRSEFTFSPGMSFNETDSRLNGTTTNGKSNPFIIPQFGFVFTDRKPDEVISKWRSGSLGIGFTRLNDFNTRTNFEGTVTNEQSLVQSLFDNVQNRNLTQSHLLAEYGTNGNNITSLEGLAYATSLLFFDGDRFNRDSLVAFPRRGPITQKESIISSGAQNQWDLSYGASYQDKLFIGGSIGLMTLRYRQQRNYQEIGASSDPNFTALTLNDAFTTRGSGINFKIGVIYKPVDALRVGATVQTPTFMNLTNTYNSSLSINYKEGVFGPNTAPTTVSHNTLDGIFEYNLTTPFRANAGAAYVIGKYGFISGDVEYLNYRNASFNIEDDFDYFGSVNRRIANTYESVLNFRLGAEARFDIFRLRAGFAHYGDPYSASALNRTRKLFTGGIGIRESSYFVDAAYVHGTNTSYYSPYSLNSNAQPIVETKNRNAGFIVTAGFNF